jgi:NAD(P)H-dependent FMN reductase
VKQLLIVWHSMTGGSALMARAAADAARQEGGVRVRLRRAAEASGDDLLAADGYLFVCPENLATMAGAMKDFFDRSYYAALDRINGRPYALLVCAGSDGQGAVRQVQRICTGLRLREVAPATIVITHAQSPSASSPRRTLRRTTSSAAARSAAHWPPAWPLACSDSGGVAAVGIGQRGGDHDLDLPAGLGQGSLHRGAGRLAGGGDPLVPHRVHSRKVRHVGKIDLRHQQVLLAGAGAREQLVHRGEHLAGLAGDVGRCIRGDLTGEPDNAVADHGFGHAHACIQAGNACHCVHS